LNLRSVLVITILFSFSVAYGQNNTKYVKPQNENLRAAANGDKIGELMGGTAVTILEEQGNWSRIRVEGWIWKPSLANDPSKVDNFTIRVSHILVKTQQEAASLLTKIQQGGDFAELAKQYSIDPSSKDNGGDVGFFSRGDLMPEFEAAAFKLKVGEISGIVKTKLGYHIIKRLK
jgi:parvulin-like peptidyl-prolyl isomerase